eukprot:4304120-Pleurochrysis_carterae.AAC.1
MPGTSCSRSAGPPALAAPWPLSGCWPRAPRSANRSALTRRGAPPRPACASSPPLGRGPRCGLHSGAAPAPRAQRRPRRSP